MNGVPAATKDGIAVYCQYDEIRELNSLLPHPKNPNFHPQEQLNKLALIIRRAGWRMPITVSALSGFIVKGHGRMMAAKLAGLTEAPVEVQHYPSEAVELADLLADNRLAELAELDHIEAVDILRELMESEADLLDLTGFDLSDLEVPAESSEAEFGSLESRYLLPPFSILDADRATWRERREAWNKIINR